MSMRAALIEQVGGTPKISQFPEPLDEGESEVVVTVELAGLNPADIALSEGRFGPPDPTTPYVAGMEGVGRLEPDGPLFYFGGATAPFGSFAPLALVKRERLIQLPQGTDSSQALVFGVAGQAGWLSVSWRSGLTAGERVIVLGASGTVGQIAIHAARAGGASRIVGVVRSESGATRAQAAGADATVLLDQAGEADEGLTERLLEAAEGPAAVVIDMLWGQPALAALAALGTGGRLVQVGTSSGQREIEIAAGILGGRGREIRGYSNGIVPDQVRRAAFIEMCERSAAGELTIEVEEVPLDDVAEAWQRQRRGPGRKLVIRP